MRSTIVNVAAAAVSVYISGAPTARAAPFEYRQAAEAGELVETNSGSFQGKASEIRPAVSEYLGIPFAQPPVGDLRFKAPAAVAAANGTIDATTFVCLVLSYGDEVFVFL